MCVWYKKRVSIEELTYIHVVEKKIVKISKTEKRTHKSVELKLYHCLEMTVSCTNYSTQNSPTHSEEKSVARGLMP